MKAATAVAIAASFAASLSASFACADPGPYVGGGIGRAHARFDSGSFASNSPNIVDSTNANKTGETLFAGYDVNRNWAVEGGYTHFGTFKYNYGGINALAGGSGQATYGASSWWLAGKGTLPVSSSFDLFGKLGLSENRARDSESTNSAGMDAVLGTPVTRNTNKAGLLAGVGAEYHVNKAFGVRMEYDNYGKFGGSGTQNLAKIGMWTADVTYHF